jgi:tetratricopeptide (TPR) repeat protein
MRRVISFFSREGFVWPLGCGIPASWFFWIQYRRGTALPLGAACIVLFVVPYLTRYFVALRLPQVRRVLVKLFMWIGLLSIVLQWTAIGRFGSLVLFGYCALAFGCVFWASSDPAYSLIEWLSFPTEYGRPPDEIRLLDQRVLSWPDDPDPDECWLFRYRYGDEWDIGFTGPFTFSLMGVGLDRRPVEDIYAAYRDWSSQEGIREMRQPNGSGEQPNSLEDLNKAIWHNPKDAQAYSLRSLAWIEKGNFENALRDADEAILLKPDDALLYGLRASVHVETKNFDKAVHDLDLAIRLDPTAGMLYSGRGCASREKGDFGNALMDFAKAIELTPESPESYTQRAWLWATATDAQYRDGLRAVESATKACELLGWTDTDALDTLAAAHAECGNWEDAVKWQTNVVEKRILEKDILEKTSPTDLADAEARLELYRSGKPYRDDGTKGCPTVPPM